MSLVTSCQKCGLPIFHGAAGYAGAQCHCHFSYQSQPPAKQSAPAGYRMVPVGLLVLAYQAVHTLAGFGIDGYTEKECLELSAILAAALKAAPPEKYKMQPYQTVDKGSTNYKAGWNAGINAMLAAAPKADVQEPVKKWKCRHSADEKWFISDRPGYWECVPIEEEPQPASDVVKVPRELLVRLLNADSDIDKEGSASSTLSAVARYDAAVDELRTLLGGEA